MVSSVELDETYLVALSFEDRMALVLKGLLVDDTLRISIFDMG